MKPKPEAFLDSSTLIYAQEVAGSNSELLVELLLDGRFTAYICQRVLKEVVAFNRRHYSRKAAQEARYLLHQLCRIIPDERFVHLLTGLEGIINPKDREQVAATRVIGLKHLVGYDRDFEPIAEYFTPRSYVIHLGERPRNPEY